MRSLLRAGQTGAGQTHGTPRSLHRAVGNGRAAGNITPNGKESVMGATEPAYSAQPVPAGPSRAHNGLGVAALVIGVASLVAGISFVLFPLALLGGLVGVIIAIVALSGGKARGATNAGQAIAGLICSVLALIIAIDLSVHVGTWAARNTSVFTRFDKCVAQAGNRSEVATCISNFANEVRR
jgi:hypothetical protein